MRKRSLCDVDDDIEQYVYPPAVPDLTYNKIPYYDDKNNNMKKNKSDNNKDNDDDDSETFPPLLSTMRIKVGDIVDILCPDGIFCPAEVLEIEKKVRLGGQQHERDDNNNDGDGDDNRLELKDIISVKIHYVGWENEWDESVTNLCRIRPGWTYTYKCRAWVRLSDKFCHWPCVLFVRRPYRKAAISHLKAENKMYIMPCGKNEKPIVPFKPGMWFKAKSITSFEKGYQVKVEEGRNDKRYGSHFISAVQELVSMDDVLPYPFSFIGTYEVGESKKRLEKRVKHVHVGNDQKRHV
jgi:hypothetical protein